MERKPGTAQVEVHRLPADHIRAAALRDGLTGEYLRRYGPSAYEEMNRWPSREFDPPHGEFLLLTLDDKTVAGGGFRRYDAMTAELKRMWTDPRHRRLGLAGRTLAELETSARRLGYRRLYLSTGPRQPEAAQLYESAGFRPMPSEPAADGKQALCFEKPL